MSHLILRILQNSNDSQKLKLRHDFYSHCFSLHICYCTCSLCKFFCYVCQRLLYFKPVENSNGEQNVKLPDPTSPPMKEISSSAISSSNNDVECLIKEFIKNGFL